MKFIIFCNQKFANIYQNANEPKPTSTNTPLFLGVILQFSNLMINIYSFSNVI